MNDAPRGLTHHPAPPDPRELAGFPVRRTTGEWYRAHVDRGGLDHGCWWFSSVGPVPEASGRFDLPAPEGTCYLASTEEAAARERVGTHLRRVAGRESVIASVLGTVDGPVVVSRTDPGDVRAANLPVRSAQRWVNRSLAVGTGIYATTQAWAAAFRAAGFGGIVYEPRFTSGARVRALAVFDRAGRRRPVPRDVRSRPIRSVLEEGRVRVVDPPARAPAVLAPDDAPPAL